MTKDIYKTSKSIKLRNPLKCVKEQWSATQHLAGRRVSDDWQTTGVHDFWRVDSPCFSGFEVSMGSFNSSIILRFILFLN